jgi:SMC interacting uncharacterized protein involved in chromosome segregation
MEYIHDILKPIVAAILGVMGWIIKRQRDDIDKLKSDLSTLKETLPKEYLMKSDFNDFKDELFKRLDRIETKIDTKN